MPTDDRTYNNMGHLWWAWLTEIVFGKQDFLSLPDTSVWPGDSSHSPELRWKDSSSGVTGVWNVADTVAHSKNGPQLDSINRQTKLGGSLSYGAQNGAYELRNVSTFCPFMAALWQAWIAAFATTGTILISNTQTFTVGSGGNGVVVVIAQCWASSSTDGHIFVYPMMTPWTKRQAYPSAGWYAAPLASMDAMLYWGDVEDAAELGKMTQLINGLDKYTQMGNRLFRGRSLDMTTLPGLTELPPDGDTWNDKVDRLATVCLNLAGTREQQQDAHGQWENRFGVNWPQ